MKINQIWNNTNATLSQNLTVFLKGKNGAYTESSLYILEHM